MNQRLTMHPVEDIDRASRARHFERAGVSLMLLILLATMTGCASLQPGQSALRYERQLEQQRASRLLTAPAHWAGNRAADLMDIFELGIGVSSENTGSGWFPGSLGAHVEATSFFNLGAVPHNGATLDWDGRGMGAYSESRTVYGIGPLRTWRIHQGDQHVNFYKDPVRSKKWRKRMEEELGAYTPVADELEATEEQPGEKDARAPRGLLAETIPAKVLLHKDVGFRTRWFGRPRGWQHWGAIGGEVAVSEPFLLHHGVMLKAKVDPSEILDFLLGFVGYDFKQDDRQDDE